MRKALFLLINCCLGLGLMACADNAWAEDVPERIRDGNETALIPTPLPTQEPDEAPVMGIEYSWWMRLDQANGGVYETVDGDVSYKLVDYGNYMRVIITNNGSTDAYAGGEYRLQRLENGIYTDIEDDVNLIYNGVHVKDMPLILLHDEADGSEISLPAEDDQFVIKPGQTIKAEFLTMRYRIFENPEYNGDYRLIYGDVVIDFKLFCDTVC